MSSYERLATSGKIRVGLLLLEGAAALPLSYSMAYSAIELVGATVVIYSLSAIALSGVQSRSLRIGLEAVNLGFWAAALALAILPWVSTGAATPAVVLPATTACLIAAAWRFLPNAEGRADFIAAELSLAAVISAWILVEPARASVHSGVVLSSPHLVMGIRFLFLGPLALVPIVAYGQANGWKLLSKWLAAACVWQFCSGLIEVGDLLDSYWVGFSGILVGGLTLLGLLANLVVALVHRQDSASASVPGR